MRILFVANSRIPSERAMGTAIMKQCEAFSRFGLTVELVVPRRYNEHTEDPFVYHRIKYPFKLRYLWSLDLAFLGDRNIRFYVQRYTFILSLMVYALRSNADIVYGREPELIFPLITRKYKFVELHHLHGLGILGNMIIRSCTGIITITRTMKADLISLFSCPSEKIHTAPSGVNLEAFETHMTKPEARKKLGITTSLPVASYIGALEEWKGYMTFLDASVLLKGTVHCVVIGGVSEQVEKLRLAYPHVQFLGTLPQNDLQDNQQIADVLIVPNSNRAVISARYSSPLKVFAHMASGIPIVATRTTALEEVLHDENAILVEPDNAVALAAGISTALSDPLSARLRAQRAQELVGQYSWNARTPGLVQFIEDRIHTASNMLGEAKRGVQQGMGDTRNILGIRVIKSFCITNKKEIIKYIVVGGIATLVDLLANYVLNFFVWYLYASILAFFLTFSTSFVLQKFWTFREQKLSRIPVQLSVSLSFALIILLLNTILMYVLVSYGHVHYLHARIVVLGVLALLSYMVNKFIIFR